MDSRELLRRRLVANGFLRATPGQPIVLRDGAPAPWILYLWNESLDSQGARLMADCFLAELQHFRSRQLACLGYTGMPMLLGCLLGGEGYTGLCVRDERKPHGTCRRVDGPGDRSRPVVVLDDSISSGHNMTRAIEALEQEGFTVEGALCLVRFPWRGGFERLAALGYQCRAVFDDVWTDLECRPLDFVPGYQGPEPRWGEALPDGLHPTQAARRMIEQLLAGAALPRPPARFDTDYQAPGGVFISLRSVPDDYRRARDGFWHFDPEQADFGRDLALAAQALVTNCRPRLRTLDGLKLGLSLLGPFEKVKPGQCDFNAYGVVARSRGLGSKLGGALPNTQVIHNTEHQLRHARWTNACIFDYEPMDYYRYTVEKLVEPGHRWLAYGGSTPTDAWAVPAQGQAMLDFVAEVMAGQGNEDDLCSQVRFGPEFLPVPVDAVAVTLYHRGIVGCGMAYGDSLERCLFRAARLAASDPRAASTTAVSVTIFHDQEQTASEPATNKMRPGLDGVSVFQADRVGFFLPSVCVYQNWDRDQTRRALLDKVGIGTGGRWAIYPTVTWLSGPSGPCKLRFGFRERAQMPGHALELLAGYLARSIDDSGLPAAYYYPIGDQILARGSVARAALSLYALEQAALVLGRDDWLELARRGYAGLVPETPIDGALTLLATGSLQLIEEVAGMVCPDGRITPRADSRGVGSDHDFLPGTVLLALARRGRLPDLEACLDFYRRRFGLIHPWGMVGWQTQAWEAIHALDPRPEYAEFVFAMADWALDYQEESTGGFMTGLHPDGPSFHTGFVAEGLCAAWRLARRVAPEKEAAYGQAFARAMDFLAQLVLLPEDAFALTNPERAVGGVRGSLNTSWVRNDFVAHSLLALVYGHVLTHGDLVGK
ncbi:MAG: AMMECR1 domain-containing protein [Vulcanimicrobiota bacterium]